LHAELQTLLSGRLPEPIQGYADVRERNHAAALAIA